MDTYSSGEDLVIKTRKPYTITKQRERWTEEEHNRFLEALKLYGRAWQRIEEHIGTKTAVQIRSHAQKFFTKLEKEALVKGVPIGHTIDIEIPPPRPKRKPSNPYPRKTGGGMPTPLVGEKDGKHLSSVSSFCMSKQILDLEREPLPEKPGGDEKPGNAKEIQDEDNCSEVLTLFREAPCNSLSSANKDSMPTPVAPRNSCSFKEYVPMMVSTQDETNESNVSVGPKRNQATAKFDAKQAFQDNGTNNTSNFDFANHSHEKLVQGKKDEKMSQPENIGTFLSNDMQATQNYPRHVPVHVLNGNLGISTQNVSPAMSCQESILCQMGGIHGHPNPFTNTAASATTKHHSNVSRSSFHQSFPPFHPLFTPIPDNQDNYQSYINASSTFSSLIVSTLVQNPAAHAAASFAATFWPCANMEASADSPIGTFGGFPSRQINPVPSMAAIAAATVAAATAWWAAHGLLPLCTPFHTGFTCTPASTVAAPTDTGLATAGNNDKRETASRDLPSQNQQLDPENSEALQEQHSASKLSDSEESEGAKPNSGLAAADHEKAAAVTKPNDSNKTKSRKQMDRSSCGSNTASSSEVETDALDKNKKDKEESKEPDASHPAGDSINRRGRSSSSTNDSWKEVSEEGRLAFQALFSREVLPQSFSPPQDLKNEGYQKRIENDEQNADEKAEDASKLDLNCKTWGPCSSHQPVENSTCLRGENNGERLLSMDIVYGKLKPRRTGFKPYKRCAVEAMESKVANANSQGEEKGPKRIRLGGEAST